LGHLALEDTDITFLNKVWNHTAKQHHIQEGLKPLGRLHSTVVWQYQASSFKIDVTEVTGNVI